MEQNPGANFDTVKNLVMIEVNKLFPDDAGKINPNRYNPSSSATSKRNLAPKTKKLQVGELTATELSIYHMQVDHNVKPENALKNIQNGRL